MFFSTAFDRLDKQMDTDKDFRSYQRESVFTGGYSF
jgi:hypothetical protein